LEWRPWFGPVVGSGSSTFGSALTTADVRRAPRRGTSSRMRHRAYAPARGHHHLCLPSGRRVLRSVLRPVRVDPHYARPVERRFVVGRSFRYHGWANPREWEEPALGPFERAQRGSPRVTASARVRAWHVREGRRSRPPSLRGLKSPGLSSARRVSIVAEVVRRRRTSNKLGKRAPKRAVRVE